MPTVFPIGMPTFHLRRDFPLELGYLELWHPPSVSEQQIVGFFECVLARSVSREFIRAVLALVESSPPPRYFAYHYKLSPPHPHQCSCWLTDGTLETSVPREGLWRDMVARYAVAHGYSPIEADRYLLPRHSSPVRLSPRKNKDFPSTPFYMTPGRREPATCH
jgi:hypothetical protein